MTCMQTSNKTDNTKVVLLSNRQQGDGDEEQEDNEEHEAQEKGEELEDEEVNNKQR